MNEEALPMLDPEDQVLPPIGPAPVKLRKVALHPDDFVMPDGKVMDPEELGIEPDYTIEVHQNSFEIDEKGDLDALFASARAAAEAIEDEEVKRIEAVIEKREAQKKKASPAEQGATVLTEAEPIHLYDTVKAWLIRQRPHIKEWTIALAVLLFLLLWAIYGTQFILFLTVVGMGAIVAGVYLTSNGGAARKEWEAKYAAWRAKDKNEAGGENDVLEN